MEEVKLYTMRILIAMLFTGGSSSDKYSIDKNRAVWCYRTSVFCHDGVHGRVGPVMDLLNVNSFTSNAFGRGSYDFFVT
jgi:hypothetical protein